MRAPHPDRGLISRSARPRAVLSTAWVIFACLPAALRAQNDDPPPPGTPMYTLHVYTNLVQIPTLVLNQDLLPLPPLSKDQFTLSIDGGPKFRPTQIHLQAEDPIVLAILLDASGTEQDLMRKASTAIASLAQHALTPRDRVAIFAFDCSLVAVPTLLHPVPEVIRTATEDLLKAPALHGPKVPPRGCYRRSNVWTAMASATIALTKFNGRRVLVAVTDAMDYDSKITRNDLLEFAVDNSIPVFSVDYDNRVRNPLDNARIRASQTDLQLLTSGSGGLILQTAPDTFADTLQRIIALLRGRYIIEFPRPSNNNPGKHIIDVKIPRRDSVIRTAGVSVPTPGDKELYDPDNVPTDRTRAPTIGKSKPPRN